MEDNRPNLLEILEQTTHANLDNQTYMEQQFLINGLAAQLMFGDVDTIYSRADAKANFDAIAATIKSAYDVVSVSNDLTSDEKTYFDYYMSYYTKEKEVGYLSMQVDDLVDKCIQHQTFCFVLNMVHRELMAAEHQLSQLKVPTNRKTS